MKKLLIFFVIVTVGSFLLGSQFLFAQSKGEVKMEWLSHSHFRFTSPTGKIWLTNPHLDNVDNKTKLEDLAKVDVILVADGHGDEIDSGVLPPESLAGLGRDPSHGLRER
jgi:hypothetical protein